jgi:hypothetical protein
MPTMAGHKTAGAVDVPTRIRSHKQAGAELLRRGAVLDHPEWNPLHGMPAFGEVETPDHVWNLVNYVRTLPGDSQKGDSTK